MATDEEFIWAFAQFLWRINRPLTMACPDLVSKLFAVQPLEGPTGLIYYKDFIEKENAATQIQQEEN